MAALPNGLGSGSQNRFNRFKSCAASIKKGGVVYLHLLYFAILYFSILKN